MWLRESFNFSHDDGSSAFLRNFGDTAYFRTLDASENGIKIIPDRRKCFVSVTESLLFSENFDAYVSVGIVVVRLTIEHLYQYLAHKIQVQIKCVTFICNIFCMANI
jgi:hypothetical protein